MKASRKAAGLTVVLFSLTALLIGGCSTDNRITAPGTEAYPDIDKGQAEQLIIPQSGNNLARTAAGDNDTESPRFTIIAEAQRIDIEGGCFFLKADDGNIYTPVTPKDLTLKEGIVLKAEGYIDKDIVFFCGNGPAFVIEEYEIIEEKQIPKDDVYDKGLITDDGSEDRYKDYSFDRAKAMNKKFEEKRKLNSPSEDRAPDRTYDNGNDRPLQPYDDRGLDEMGDRGQDDKREAKEEQRPGDPSDNDQGFGRP